MDDFIFDLQRFDETPTTVLSTDAEYVLTFGSGEGAVKRTVSAGTDNISLTTIEGGNAVISLSAASERQRGYKSFSGERKLFCKRY